MKAIHALEKTMIFISILLFAAGAGLMVDGKKIYARQLKLSERVDYKMTLNPY